MSDLPFKRLSIDIDLETHRKLQVIPHGSRKRVIRYLIEVYADMIDKNPAETIARILTADLRIEDLTEDGRPRKRT